MAEQVLFKYRSLENWQFLLDILVNKRLYAAPFKDLNDPMEGRYYYFGDEMTKAFRRVVRARKDDWRICSLTKDPNNTLMWSYYSGGHTGVALGLTVPSSSSCRIRDVFYDSQIGIGPSSQRRPAREVALDILSQKQLSWAHEREVRVFSPSPYVPIRLREIRLGVKASAIDRELLDTLVRRTNPRVRIVQVTRADLDAPPEAFEEPAQLPPRTHVR
jgi:hypothetical protein